MSECVKSLGVDPTPKGVRKWLHSIAVFSSLSLPFLRFCAFDRATRQTEQLIEQHLNDQGNMDLVLRPDELEPYGKASSIHHLPPALSVPCLHCSQYRVSVLSVGRVVLNDVLASDVRSTRMFTQ